MIDKSEDFLTAKLRQLKSSVQANQTSGPRVDKSPLRASGDVQNDATVTFEKNQPYEPPLQLPKIGHITFAVPETQTQIPMVYPKSILRNADSSKTDSVTAQPPIIKIYGGSAVQPSVKLTLPEYEAKVQFDNRKVINSALQQPEVRRPRSQEIIEDMPGAFNSRVVQLTERSPLDFGQTLQTVSSVYRPPSNNGNQFITKTSSHYLNKSTEPVTKVSYASKVGAGPFTALNQTTPLNDYQRYIQSQGASLANYSMHSASPDPRVKSEFLSQTRPPIDATYPPPGERLVTTLPLKTVQVQTQSIVTSQPDPTNLLDSINLQKQYQADANMLQLLDQLNKKIIDQINQNNQLSADIVSLKKRLEREKQTVQDTNDQLQIELKHAKSSEEELIRQLNDNEENLATHSRRRIDISGQSADLVQKYQELLNDNDRLRADLKRMGELSMEKILDFENGINSIARMKNLEVENHAMNKEKMTSQADFTCEQMRVQFNSRMNEILAQIDELGEGKLKVDADLKALQGELANYNQYANQKMNNELAAAISKEEDRAERERQAIQQQVDLEEAETKELNRLMEEGLARMKRIETEGRARINAKRMENIRLREELQNEESGYQKLLLSGTQERNTYAKKEDELMALKDELQDLQARTNLLGTRYDQEVNGLHKDGQQMSKAIEDEIEKQQTAERELLKAIEAEKTRIANLLTEQQQMVAQVEATLAKAVQLSTQRPGK